MRTINGASTIRDRDFIFLGWVQEESKRIGRELIEGLDYDLFRKGDSLFLAYYSDPDYPDKTQLFEITDTPILN